MAYKLNRKTTLKRKVLRKRRSSMKLRNVLKKRVRFEGGAAEEMSFKNLNELSNYLEKNKNWIFRIDVYRKKDYHDNKKALHHFTPLQKNLMYELPGDIKDYVFLFY